MEITIDLLGNLLIIDRMNNRVRLVAVASGVITTLIGNGTAYSGDGQVGNSVSLNYPFGLAVGPMGRVFVCDSRNHRVRRVPAPTPPSSSSSVMPSSSSTKRPVSVTPTRTASPTATASGTRSSSPSYAPGIITTVAGTGAQGFSGDGGAATSAAMNQPIGVAFDTEGNMFIADLYNRRVRRTNAGTGVISTVAGTGVAGSSGDGGAATGASLNQPYNVAVDFEGNLLIVEYGGHLVRRVTTSTGTISTYAGTGVQGFGGDGGAATNARLNQPVHLAMHPTGSLLIADHSSHRVRRVDVGTGIITTVAGNGVQGFSGDGGAATSASLNGPYGLASDQVGNIFITDFYNQRVRKVAIATGRITTVAGRGNAGFSGDSGAATSASLNFPIGLAFDQSDNMLIADTDNCRVRRVEAGTGIITTVAGTGACGFSGDGSVATSARLSAPVDVAFDPAGNLIIAERDNHRLRMVSVQPSSTPSATPSSTPYCAPSLFRPLLRTDLVGTLVGTALTPGEATLVASEAACRQACCDAPVCEGFAFNADTARFHAASRCYLYVNVTQLIPSSGFASGVLESVL